MNVVPLSLHSEFKTRHQAAWPEQSRSMFPAYAHALIYKPAPSAMTSGRAARREQWKLVFERRSAQYVEPLMGWTADDDPLSQIELSFPSAEAAIAYARRQGLDYTVQGLQDHEPRLRLVSDRTNGVSQATRTQRQRRLEWVERTLGPEVIRTGFGPGAEPAMLYAEPEDVLRDPDLSPDQQWDMLRRWALEAYQIEREHGRGKPEAEPSRLEHVIDALTAIEEEILDKKAG
ncbi:MAG TPA: ETC complex I subunit [Bradyrhizobium sp.]|uniref:ETC complex I subunit n=1 Tax=Bradyrhizobium sp. TaxID=376 RepID=UPI002B47BB50|nr:ETC complex I subunit [Bradyrhizobium sp.]HKO69399.1 ETC complex I subunit [Bradyrhizobium sp.]